jgi:two-component system OmpR family sensor kinase/two-component system sensor histidine kinase BaeS
MKKTDFSRDSVSQIRRRLFMLLLRAFAAIVLLMVLLSLVVSWFVFSAIARGSFSYRPQLVSLLETYYLARGDWEGVQEIFSQETPFNRETFILRYQAVLLDRQGKVVLDHGLVDTSQVGQIYAENANDVRFPLQVRGESIGVLVLTFGASLIPLRAALAFLAPLVILTFFTGLVTVFIGLLLVRRVVTPLADVIDAAKRVAAGELSARVQVGGPDDMRLLSDSFNHMAGTLERNEQQRRALLADIAHELRTPLSVIRGLLEGIVDKIYPVDVAHIAPVLEETYLLERLVDDLRTLALAETRQLPLHPQPLDMGEVAARVIDLFKPLAVERGIKLSLIVEPGLPLVLGDAQRMEQVIGNLISNALLYLPDRGEVAINLAIQGNELQLTVNDNGAGVPEAELSRVFDRFWRGEKSRARSSSGAGLGLAIARQLIEAQGGRMWASNLPGGGLSVTFVLPLIIKNG